MCSSTCSHTLANFVSSQWLREELLPYLQKWEDSVSERKGFSPKAKTMMVLTKETRFGIRVIG